MFRIRARMISNLLSGTVAALTATFGIVFCIVLSRFFPLLNTPDGFFGSANVIMYVTIEGLFLFIVLYGAYVAIRRREYKD
jgi:hypothetical protein